MFEVSVEETFAAAHALRRYHGKCENVHGHNYRVRVTLEGQQLEAAGLLIDFGEVKRLMRSLIERWDHRFLNELPPFDVYNPTAENMAKCFYDEISKGLEAVSQQVPVRVAEVRIWETETATATYRPS